MSRSYLRRRTLRPPGSKRGTTASRVPGERLLLRLLAPRPVRDRRCAGPPSGKPQGCQRGARGRGRGGPRSLPGDRRRRGEHPLMARRAGVRTNAAQVARDLDRLGDDFAKEALIPAMRAFTRTTWRARHGRTGFRSRSGRLARSIVADEPKSPGQAAGCAAACRVTRPTRAGHRIRIRGQAQRFFGPRCGNLPQSTPDYVDAAVAKFIRKRGF